MFDELLFCDVQTNVGQTFDLNVWQIFKKVVLQNCGNISEKKNQIILNI